MNLLALRNTMRKQRRTLTTQQQRQAAQAIVNHMRHLAWFKQAHHIGLYHAAFGEVPTHLIAQLCQKLGKKIYLPVIKRWAFGLKFVPVSVHVLTLRLARHSLGMRQPSGRAVSVRQLDIVFLPLVAVDIKGTRLGMGGGFYDKTLSKVPFKKPLRIGLAYDFQYVEYLPRQPWDQPLHGCIFPQRGFIKFSAYKSGNEVLFKPLLNPLFV